MTRPSRSLPVLLLTLCLLGTGAACRLRAEAGGLWVKPYLQDPRPDGMTILWWTSDCRAESYVEFGDRELDRREEATARYVPEMGKCLRQATLTGLLPERPYLYRVRSGNQASEQFTFRTSKGRHSDLLVSFLGDGRTDNPQVISRHRQLLQMAAGSDLIFEIGDQVQEGTRSHWETFLRRILTSSDPEDPGPAIGSEVPCHLVVGNHELAVCAGPPCEEPDYYRAPFVLESVRRYQAITSNPPNGATSRKWEGRYYSIRYGPATFIVLDTNRTTRPDLANHDYLAPDTTPDWEPGSEQYQWMVAELARARAESVFTFVLMHPAPYSPGIHGTPFHEENHQRGYELRALDPVFREQGVDAVIASHDHMATRSLVGPPGFEDKMDDGDPLNLNYLVMGNSGESARPKAPGWERWMSVRGDGKAPFFTRWYYDWEGKDEQASFVRLQIVNEGSGAWTATLSMVRGDGQIFDPLTLHRRDPKHR